MTDYETFHVFTAINFAEASENLIEACAIANVTKNRSKSSGRTIIDIVENTGYDAYNSTNYNFSSQNRSNENQKLINARIATINAISDSYDFSHGSYFFAASWVKNYYKNKKKTKLVLQAT